MGKRSRQNRPRHVGGHPATVTDPEAEGTGDTATAGLLARIADGRLDEDLPLLIDAINTRVRAVQELRTGEALAQLSIGSRVRFNHTVSPRYLHGQCGEVHDIDGDHVVVCLDVPAGRFTSGHVRCSPLALERTDTSGT